MNRFLKTTLPLSLVLRSERTDPPNRLSRFLVASLPITALVIAVLSVGPASARKPAAQPSSAAQPSAPQPSAPQPSAPQPSAPQPSAPQPNAKPAAALPSAKSAAALPNAKSAAALPNANPAALPSTKSATQSTARQEEQLSIGQEKAQSDADLPIADPPIALPSHLIIETPDGWSALPGLSQTIALTAEQTAYFGEDEIQSGAIAFGRASRGALYITWVQGKRVVIKPEIAIRAAFDAIHQTPYLAGTPGSTQEISYREQTVGNLSEMTWEWAHTENATINIVRVLGWKDQESHTHLEIAECILPKEGDESDAARLLCDNALASMHLGPGSDPAPLGALPPPKPVSAITADTFTVPKLTTGDLSGTNTGTSIGVPPKQLGEVLYQGKKPARQSEDNSHRIFIGIGVALLGLAFWLTTRSDPNEKKTWAKDDPKPDPEANRLEVDSDADDSDADDSDADDSDADDSDADDSDADSEDSSESEDKDNESNVEGASEKKETTQ